MLDPRSTIKPPYTTPSHLPRIPGWSSWEGVEGSMVKRSPYPMPLDHLSLHARHQRIAIEPDQAPSDSLVSTLAGTTRNSPI